MSEQPIWTDEALSRLLGASDGYVHSLVEIKLKIGYLNYYRIDPRHVRKLAEREAMLKPLREIQQRLDADLRSCQEAYRTQYERAHPKAKVA